MNHLIQELLSRGVSEIYIKSELSEALNSGKKLRAYYGVDPSGPTIHLGHAVLLRKLQILQELGHKIIFLIGDFTGMIGDPTDRGAVRQPLTRAQVLKNAKTYKKQVSKFLSFSGKNPAEIRFNSEWNDKLSFKDIIELSGKFTVQQFLERDMFEKRMQEGKPIGLHEFLYPLIQGNDAVVLGADLQVGGTDQTFNMLQGRYLTKALKNKNQMVLTAQLLVGSDGRKMGKSFNNIIAIQDPPKEMFGKAMAINDSLIKEYFVLATQINDERIKEILGMPNPKDQKLILAEAITAIYYGQKQADMAKKAFISQFSKKERPSDIQLFVLPEGKYLVSAILATAGFVNSKSEARRLIMQKGVKVDERLVETDFMVEINKMAKIFQIGKRKYKKIQAQ